MYNDTLKKESGKKKQGYKITGKEHQAGRRGGDFRPRNFMSSLVVGYVTS